MKPLEILRRSFRNAEIPDSTPVGRLFGSGVYLLVDGNGDIVYVGASSQIEWRLYAHASGERGIERKVFDRALWMPLPALVHHHYEGALIRALAPKYNRRAPRNRGYDAEILWGLGLREDLKAGDIAKRAA